jgi:hypothetical protein
MSWATENKFLTGYIVVMALGAGALGYQVFSASGAYDAATETYNSKAQAYNNLRKQAPTPNRDNLAKLEAQKKDAAEVINAFQADLAKREFPLTPMSPAEFQDTLSKTVKAVRTKADGAGVRLGKDRDKEKDKFYLGFQRYEGSTPDQGIAAALGRDLKAIEWVVDQLIETPVIAINDIKRPELPQESRKAATPPPKAVPGKGPAGTPASNLVTTHSFDIHFTCRQQQLAKVLNVLVNPSAPQFLIPRNVKVANSMPKAPAKIDPAAALAASNAATPAPDPAAPAGQPAPAAPATPAIASSTIKYLLGEETVDATITLDIVDFAEPSAAEPAATTPAPRR